MNFFSNNNGKKIKENCTINGNNNDDTYSNYHFDNVSFKDFKNLKFERCTFNKCNLKNINKVEMDRSSGTFINCEFKTMTTNTDISIESDTYASNLHNIISSQFKTAGINIKHNNTGRQINVVDNNTATENVFNNDGGKQINMFNCEFPNNKRRINQTNIFGDNNIFDSFWK